jgi:hypothetical protein
MNPYDPRDCMIFTQTMCVACGAFLSPESKLLNAIFQEDDLCELCSEFGTEESHTQ